MPDNMLMDTVVIRRGKIDTTPPADAIQEFGEEDVAIKDASAIDPEGNAGVLAAGKDSGTIGGILPIVLARHSNSILHVGLEKLVPSVSEASCATGIYYFMYSTGLPVTLVPMPNAIVVTEIQAFQVLCGVK